MLSCDLQERNIWFTPPINTTAFLGGSGTKTNIRSRNAVRNTKQNNNVHCEKGLQEVLCLWGRRHKGRWLEGAWVMYNRIDQLLPRKYLLSATEVLVWSQGEFLRRNVFVRLTSPRCRPHHTQQQVSQHKKHKTAIWAPLTLNWIQRTMQHDRSAWTRTSDWFLLHKLQKSHKTPEETTRPHYQHRSMTIRISYQQMLGSFQIRSVYFSLGVPLPFSHGGLQKPLIFHWRKYSKCNGKIWALINISFWLPFSLSGLKQKHLR